MKTTKLIKTINNCAVVAASYFVIQQGGAFPIFCLLSGIMAFIAMLLIVTWNNATKHRRSDNLIAINREFVLPTTEYIFDILIGVTFATMTDPSITLDIYHVVTLPLLTAIQCLLVIYLYRRLQ